MKRRNFLGIIGATAPLIFIPKLIEPVRWGIIKAHLNFTGSALIGPGFDYHDIESWEAETNKNLSGIVVSNMNFDKPITFARSFPNEYRRLSIAPANSHVKNNRVAD